MKEIFNILTKSALAILALFGFAQNASSQCAAGEVEVSIDITTDQWGYELYWELVPSGDTCGSANAIFTGGNAAVGCAGGGLRAIFAGGYANNTMVTEGPFCLTIGQAYDIIAVDDWGDGGCSFESASQAFTFAMTGANETYTFTAALQANNDVAVGVSSEDDNGWERDYIRIPGFTSMPLSQLETSELMFGAVVKNRGLNDASNVLLTLNVDEVTGPGTFNTVYTDTLQIGALAANSVAWGYGDMDSMTWASIGDYRYQYIVSMDSVDEKTSSDTISGFFSLTQNTWSKVDLATDGGPFGDNAYLPGVTPPNFVALQEWGTMYYFPNGEGYTLDTLTVRLFSSQTAQDTQAIYQARIYKIVDDGDGVLDILLDKSLQSTVSDTVTVVPNSGYVRQLTNFLDINTFETFQFQDTSIYYITIYQLNPVAPGLNDGTVRNGLFVYGQTINHDGFVYGNGSNFQFYNPLIIQDGDPSGAPPPAIESYEYGWTGGPEPSMILNLSANPVAVTPTVEEMSGVELFPNPTVKEFTVTMNLDKASDVRYVLTDVSGKIIDIKFAKNVQNESRSWDVSNFPAGVYFLHVKANGETTTKKIVKK